jgi:hypothetical protein
MPVPHRLLAVVAAAALGCASAAARFPPPPAGTDDAAAREVLGRFARALEAGRFEEAHALLSQRWRQAYTPGRLGLDYRGAGAWGREAAARVTARLGAGEPLVRGPGWARLPVDEGRSALVVQEAGGWRVEALEEPGAPHPRR